MEHFVFLGTDPDAVAAADVLDTTGIYRGYQSEASYVIPETLDFDTAYYWRVDTFNGSEWSTGPVWNFKTRPEIPVTTDPNLVALVESLRVTTERNGVPTQ